MSDGEPTHLDLFSGIGGFALAAGWAGFKTLAFCELDPFCQRHLARRWPGILNFPDIKDLDGSLFVGVTLLTGGFPCQPFSHAGKRRGSEDDRSLWPEMLRVIDEARPDYVVGENVVGIIDMELDQVLSDLEAIGYACAPPIVAGSVAVDAPHRRQRVWVVAHSQRDIDRRAQRRGDAEAGGVAKRHRPRNRPSWESGGTGEHERGQSAKRYATLADAQHDGSFTSPSERAEVEQREGREEEQGGAVQLTGGSPRSQLQQAPADAEGERLQGLRSAGEQEPEAHGGQGVSVRDGGDGAKWDAEPGVDRVVNGVSGRIHRLRALGNAITPQVVLPILAAIMQQIKGDKK